MQATDMTIQNRTCKTVCKELRWKNQVQHIWNSARGTNVLKNYTEHIQNGAQYINVTTNLTEHIQKRAQRTNVPNNQTEHRKQYAKHEPNHKSY